MERKSSRVKSTSSQDSSGAGWSISKICYNVWFQLMVICATLFVCLALPPTLLGLSVIYLFRFIVSHSSKYFRPDLGKLLATRSAIFGSDNIYSQPLCSLVGKHVYEEDFDLISIRQKLQEHWIEAKNQDGTLRNPELQCCVSKWMGFLFWKRDPDFRIENHVNIFKTSEPGEIVTDAKLNAIISTMISKPFENGRSPWAMWIVPNYVPDNNNNTSSDSDINGMSGDKSLEEVDENCNNNNNYLSDNDNLLNKANNKVGGQKFVILHHWNHSLMDGLSSCKIYMNFTNSSIRAVLPKPSRHVQKSQCSKILNSASFIFRAPYESIKVPLESIDYNSWHLKESELTKKMDLSFTPSIPFSVINEIRNAHNVAFNSVIFTLLAGATRNFMLRSNRDKNLPEYITCGFPYPLPNPPEKLRNHITFCTVKLPVGKSDPLTRLRLTDKHLKTLKKSTVPIMAAFLMPFVGALFDFMLKILVKNRSTTIMFSNMPGPKYEIMDVMGLTFKQTMFSVGLGPGNLGIAFTCGSYNNNLRFCAELDIALSTRKLQAKDLAALIVEEVEVLKSCTVNQEV